MSAHIIDGRETAKSIYKDIEDDIARLKELGCNPRLSVILVGDNPASKIYVRNKQKACERNGITSNTIHLDAETSESELLDLLDDLNNDPSVHGILVQLPLPKQISEKKVIEKIVPEKDVDGFHPINRGKLSTGQDCLMPCTPAGMQELLKHYNIETKGKHVVVIGRSNIVGMPFAVMMAQKKEWANSTVTICHTATKDVKSFTKQADIIAVAAGYPNALTADMVKPGCTVIDVGINRISDPTTEKGYKLVGDVEFDTIKEVASAITPVPGGVGPMTIAMLLYNTVKAAKKLHNK